MIFAFVLIFICLLVISIFSIRFLILVPSYLRDIADNLMLIYLKKNKDD